MHGTIHIYVFAAMDGYGEDPVRLSFSLPLVMV